MHPESKAIRAPASGYAALRYQTTSKDYIEFLRDEINGISETLSSPTPSGEPNAYIVQTDPFFANLKGWGNAIWDLWLHNGGAEPVTMSTVGSQGPPTGDANGDGIVDILDLNMVGYAFGAREGERRYDPDLDFNQDGRIDMREIIVIAQNFGKTA